MGMDGFADKEAVVETLKPPRPKTASAVKLRSLREMRYHPVRALRPAPTAQQAGAPSSAHAHEAVMDARQLAESIESEPRRPKTTGAGQRTRNKRKEANNAAASRPRRSAFLEDADGVDAFEPAIDSLPESTPPDEALILMTTSIENATPLAGIEHSPLQALVTLKVPKLSLEMRRPPMELVAVVDNSGSMEGEKMNALRMSLAFLVRHGLNERDKLGIVTFHEETTPALAMMPMDEIGRELALEVIEDMKAGGKSNLSGGMFLGLGMFQPPSSEEAHDGVTRGMVLFTDSKSNRGTTHGPTLAMEARDEMSFNQHLSSKMIINTMGYGLDHNETQLRGLADEFGGKYYFIEKPEDIAMSFSDCLGGLTTIVAQHATLVLKTVAKEARLGLPLCGYPTSMDEAHLTCTIELGDLFADEIKDVLLALHLPRFETPREEQAPAFSATLRYTSVDSSELVEVVSRQAISRPAQPAATAFPVSTDVPLAMQALPPRNIHAAQLRLGATQAMEEATRLADAGRLDLARNALKEAAMLSKRSASDSPLVEKLVADLGFVAAGFKDEKTYAGVGRKRTEMTRMAHLRQRSIPVRGEEHTSQGHGASSAGDTAVAKPEAASNEEYVKGYVRGWNRFANSGFLPNLGGSEAETQGQHGGSSGRRRPGNVSPRSAVGAAYLQPAPSPQPTLRPDASWTRQWSARASRPGRVLPSRGGNSSGQDQL